MFEQITAKDNAAVKQYKKLAGARKFREESGLFALEGLRLCLDAAKEPSLLQTVFFTTSALKKISNAVLTAFSAFPPAPRMVEISDHLGAYLADTQQTQGVFAICKKLDKSDFTSTICKGGHYLLLHGIQDPGNLGAILRTADAVGLNAVLLSGCCDLYNPKTLRSTMGALFRLNVLERSLTASLRLCRQIGLPSYAAVVNDSQAVPLTAVSFQEGGVVVIGNEGNGLSDADAEICDRRLTIPMQGHADSLNAAMAAGIIAWEMTRFFHTL